MSGEPIRDQHQLVWSAFWSAMQATLRQVSVSVGIAEGGWEEPLQPSEG